MKTNWGKIMMKLNLGVMANGLAALLGFGAIILAIFNNSNWNTFLASSIAIFLISKIFDLIRLSIKPNK